MSRLNSTFPLILSPAPAKLLALQAVRSPTHSQFKFETRMISDDTLAATSDEVSRAEVRGKIQLQASQFSAKCASVAINFSNAMELCRIGKGMVTQTARSSGDRSWEGEAPAEPCFAKLQIEKGSAGDLALPNFRANPLIRYTTGWF